MADGPQSQGDPGANSPLHSSVPVNLPREIGGYRIQRVLGSGGMATVYAALQTQPRRTVALKVMKAGISMARGDTAHRRFTREIEILGKLRHPYIAQVYGAGTHDEGAGAVPYFVMEYVPAAKTIMEYVAAKQLDIRERLKLFVKVCAAIEHGHRRKIIHRDLKPANILIDENGDPKIIDFGVAHAADLDVASHTMHTEAGRLVGTLQYMSPEQLDATLQDLDARCDVYALGVLLYKLLTGKPPHDLESLPVYEAVRIIREESPRHPSDIKPDHFRGNRGADLETIILKAMEPDRSRRYRNAGSLGRDIVRYLADKPINARRASLLYRSGLLIRRHRAVVIASMVVGVVVVLAAIIVFDQRSGRGAQNATPSVIAPPITASIPGETEPAVDPPPLPQPIILSQHTGTITRLAFTADGTRLASASFDRSMMIWDIATGQSLASISDVESPIRHMAFNTDGTRMIIAGRSDVAYIINLTDIGSQPISLTGPNTTPIRVPGGEILAVAMNATGDLAAIALSDITLRVYRITGDGIERVHTLRSVSGAFTAVNFSRDDEYIIAGSKAGVVYVWNAADGSHLAQLDELKAEVVAVGFRAQEDNGDSADDSAAPGELTERIIAIDLDGMGMSWPLLSKDAQDREPFRGGRTPIADAEFSDDHRWLVAASANEIKVWDVHAVPPKQIGPTIAREDAVFAVAISPAGDRIAIGHANGEIMIVPFNTSPAAPAAPSAP